MQANEKIAQWLDESAGDFLLVTSPENVRWLTGFVGSFGWVLCSPKVYFLITDGRYASAARALCKGGKMEFWEYNKDLQKAYGEAQKGMILVEDNARISTLSGIKKQFANAKIVPTKSPINEWRRSKTEAELAHMKAAQAHVDAVLFPFLQSCITADSTEREVAFKLEMALRDEGRFGLSFAPIVAFGPNTARAHHAPTERTPRVGDAVLFDCGVTANGYASDMTRMAVWKRPQNDFIADYEALMSAQIATLKLVKTGASCKKLDTFCRQQLGNRVALFTHSLGHGVGLNVHESPSLSQRSRSTLVEGEVVTVEPGLYREGRYGMRLEDILVVRKDGPEVLSTSPKDLLILGN